MTIVFATRSAVKSKKSNNIPSWPHYSYRVLRIVRSDGAGLIAITLVQYESGRLMNNDSSTFYFLLSRKSTDLYEIENTSNSIVEDMPVDMM